MPRADRRLASWIIPVVALVLAAGALIIVSGTAGHNGLPANPGRPPTADDNTPVAVLVGALLGGWAIALLLVVRRGHRRLHGQTPSADGNRRRAWHEEEALSGPGTSPSS